MVKMTNWTSFSISGSRTGKRVTTWNYDSYRGWLNSKDYPAASTGEAGKTGPDYTYPAGGRLASRTWARGLTTPYTYNNAGDLSTVDYSDATPDVSYGYDRRGRQKTIGRAGAETATLTYNDANECLTEAYSGGTLDGLSVTNAYDTYLRRTNLTAQRGNRFDVGHEHVRRRFPARHCLRRDAERHVHISCQFAAGEPDCLQVEHRVTHDGDQIIRLPEPADDDFIRAIRVIRGQLQLRLQQRESAHPRHARRWLVLALRV
jgi:hypothetical protein